MPKKLTAFHLKLIAISAMFFNHVAHAFAFQSSNPTVYYWALFVGLLTFPIMAFLVVEGFLFTRSKWKYAERLLIFAFLSILPFHYAFDVLRQQPLNWVNNIFFTLALGLIFLILYERYRQPVIQFLLLIIFTGFSFYSDWGPQGVPLIFLFYYMRTHKKTPVLPLVLLFLYMSIRYWFFYFQYSGLVSIYIPLSALGVLIVIPLLLAYNGQRGYSPTWVKWGFYAFYPLHLLLLFAIRFWMYGI